MLPYHQSISTSPFNPIPPFTQISTRTLISFERKETLEKKIENFKNYPILLLRISKSLIPLFFSLRKSTSTSIFIQFSSINFISREIFSYENNIYTIWKNKKKYITGKLHTKFSSYRNARDFDVKKRQKISNPSHLSAPHSSPLESIHLFFSLSRFLVKRRDGFSLSVIRRERRK